MKTALRLCQLMVLSLLLQLSGRAFAQGCGLVPTNTDEGIICGGHRILDTVAGTETLAIIAMRAMGYAPPLAKSLRLPM